MTKPFIAALACLGSVAAVSFMSYVLPWGQMVFWGARVVGSLFGATTGDQP
ncbi:hypothetical protein JR065_12750 [Xanthomonas sp. AmX2]|nr:hypothetical protein [Xanthomonas sp.]MBN6151211.1 hypothetical protein [Xanthomonas sp.]